MVALQELDVGRLRTGGIDQVDAIAHPLGMSVPGQKGLPAVVA
jgi:hypothetical protein